MSGKSKRRKSPLGGYIDIARQAHPDYVRRDAPCDVPTCRNLVSDSRTVTWVATSGSSFSVLIRLCSDHLKSPIDDLQRLLPRLAEMNETAGHPAYLDLRDEEYRR
jgi:hypothetical protein